MLTTAFTASAWLAVAAFAVVAGGSVVIFGCWPASSSRRAAHRLMTGSLAVLIASTLATLLLQGPAAGVSDGRGTSFLRALRATLATRSGHAQELRLLVLALAAIALAAWWSKLEDAGVGADARPGARVALGAGVEADLGAGAKADVGAGADSDLGAGAKADVGAGADSDLGAGPDPDPGSRRDRRLACAVWLLTTVALAATWPISDQATGGRRWLPEAANIASLSAICVAAGGLITLGLLLLVNPMSRSRWSPSQAATDQARADRAASDQAASAPMSAVASSRWPASKSASEAESASASASGSASGSASPVAAAVAVRRFATVAMGCVVVLAISGGYQAWRNAGGPAGPADAGIGRLRAAGVAVVLLLGFGAWAWIRLTARRQLTTVRRAIRLTPPQPQSTTGVRPARRPNLPRPRNGLAVLALSLAAAIGTSAFVVAPPALSSTTPSAGAKTATRHPTRLTSGSPTVVPQLLSILGCG